jgi:rhodanese-related sulfurtransferase
MDTVDSQHPPLISASQLASRLGRADAPLVLDVRKAGAYESIPRLLPGALRVAPDDLAAAAAVLPRDHGIVACCVHGHEVSQGAARSLRAAGLDAAYLEHGLTGWIDAGLPTMAKVPDLSLPAVPGHPTRWVTRERPKIDRIACPWLIRRFIDPTARFLYVPAGEVADVAAREDAIPYDVPNVRISHRGTEGELCSFDALVADCGLDDPALHDLALIVRGADTGKPELTPQSPGLLAVSLGLSKCFPDDLAMLDAGMVVYDALYAWLRSARAETHNALLFRKP